MRSWGLVSVGLALALGGVSLVATAGGGWVLFGWFLVVAGVVVLGLAYLARSEDGDEALGVGGDLSVAGRDVQRAGRDISVAEGGAGAGHLRGNLIQGSTFNLTASPVNEQARSFERAIGNAETELDSIAEELKEAQRTGWYHHPFHLSAYHFEAVSDALADRSMWSSRKIVSDTYNTCDSFNKRVQSREWTGGPIPEPAQANVTDTDDLPRVIVQVERALGELRRVQLERVEKSSLTLAISLANFLDEVDEEGVIRLDASMAHVRLAFHVENVGDAPTGRSIVKVWVPRAVSDEILDWVTESGHAEVDRSHRPVRDRLKLPTGDGREFETQRMSWTLDEVDRLGETLYLRVECRVPTASEGEAMIPVHAEVRSAESEASADFAIRLRHVAG